MRSGWRGKREKRAASEEEKRIQPWWVMGVVRTLGVAAVSRRGIEAEDKRKIKGGLPPDKDRNRRV